MSHVDIEKRRATNRRAYHNWKARDGGSIYEERRKEIRKAGRETQAKIQALRAEMGCARCSNHDLRVLQFHHRDPSTKAYSVANMKSMRWERILEEIAKCDVLCANCHSIEHFERVEV